MRRVRIKMCGLTRVEDAGEAVRLGAEYLGFVFAPGSPRTLSPAAAERLLGRLDTGQAERVGVFRDQSARFVNEMVARCHLQLVQVHGHEPRDFPAAITVPVLRVLRAGTDATPRPSAAARIDAGPEVATRLPLPPNVMAVLIDAEDARGQSGGLGVAPPLDAVRVVLGTLEAGTRFFLSGGLRPDTVAARVAALQPWGVDVSSGLESAPGIKDPGRMAAFVAALEE
jgi:phosphoribosylanthranilate isomerase